MTARRSPTTLIGLAFSIMACDSRSSAKLAPTIAEPTHITPVGGHTSKTEIRLLDPEPFSSLVPTTKPLSFLVHRGIDFSRNTIENSTYVRNRASSQVLGVFAWKSEDHLQFTPQSTLLDNEEFVVSGAYASTVGFSTGSRPTIQSVRVVSKDGNYWTYVDWQFSEPMDVTSVLAAARINGGVKGYFIPDPNTVSRRYFRFDLQSQIALSTPVHLEIGANAKSTAGVLFIPALWSIGGATTGSFSMTIGAAGNLGGNLRSCGSNCWLWNPVPEFGATVN